MQNRKLWRHTHTSHTLALSQRTTWRTQGCFRWQPPFPRRGAKLSIAGSYGSAHLRKLRSIDAERAAEAAVLAQIGGGVVAAAAARRGHALDDGAARPVAQAC